MYCYRVRATVNVKISYVNYRHRKLIIHGPCTRSHKQCINVSRYQSKWASYGLRAVIRRLDGRGAIDGQINARTPFCAYSDRIILVEQAYRVRLSSDLFSTSFSLCAMSLVPVTTTSSQQPATTQHHHYHRHLLHG